MSLRGFIAMTACLLAGGCLSDEAARTALRKDDPRHQTAMMARITREGKTSMTGDLIRILEAEDEGVRFMAAASLHRLTGIDRGIHFAEGEKRDAILAEWRRWYEAETGEPVPEWEVEPPHQEDAGEAEAEPAGDAEADDAETKETAG